MLYDHAIQLVSGENDSGWPVGSICPRWPTAVIYQEHDPVDCIRNAVHSQTCSIRRLGVRQIRLLRYFVSNYIATTTAASPLPRHTWQRSPGLSSFNNGRGTYYYPCQLSLRILGGLTVSEVNIEYSFACTVLASPRDPAHKYFDNSIPRLESKATVGNH